MENIISSSKELLDLRTKLANNGFGTAESKFNNTLYAIKKDGQFKNGLGKIAIEYWPGSDKFLIMGLFYNNLEEVISYLNS